MFARSTTVHGDPMRIDDGIRYVRDEVMPTVQDMAGCVGLSMMCDRESGRCIVTTSWDSMDSMAASRDGVRAMRDRAMEIMGGRMELQEWEIGILHRAHSAPDGAACRVTWTRGDPARIDEMMSTFRTSVLPRLDDMQGFCSLSLMGDRQSGLSVLTAVYDDRDAMQRASSDVMAMREQFMSQMGLEMMDTAEMEMVIHRLRVPEMA